MFHAKPYKKMRFLVVKKKHKPLCKKHKAHILK